MAITKDFFKRSKSDPKITDTTRVTIRFDVGFPNSISIRGSGDGLSWDRGQILKNISRDTWVFEANGNFSPFEFKVLINDQMYELGQNHTLKPGDSYEYTPAFY